jgi:hypothetical protein
MANGRCRMHEGPSTGAPKGNRNAFKHVRYTAEALALQRINLGLSWSAFAAFPAVGTRLQESTRQPSVRATRCPSVAL